MCFIFYLNQINLHLFSRFVLFLYFDSCFGDPVLNCPLDRTTTFLSVILVIGISVSNFPWLLNIWSETLHDVNSQYLS